MVDKKQYLESVISIMGDAVDWNKLSKSELELLHQFFSKAPLVVGKFIERMTDEEIKQMFGGQGDANNTQQTEDDGGKIGIPILDNLLKDRPIIKQLLTGGITLR